MSKVRTLIMRAQGTNCDGETAFAFQRAGAAVSLVHVNRLIRREERDEDYFATLQFSAETMTPSR